MTNASKSQIKKWYTSRGYQARISRDGHITFQAGPNQPWCEGRWIEEYFVINDNVCRK